MLSSRVALSDRRSTFGRALVGIELMLDPPSIRPKWNDARGTSVGEQPGHLCVNRVVGRLSSGMGSTVPKSLQLWPSQPLIATSKRRLDRPVDVMSSVVGPSSTTKAAAFSPIED